MAAAGREPVPADDEKPDLLEALRPVKTELRCAVCGYGVVAREAPDNCPMCQATDWEPVAWRPFSRRPGVVLPQSGRLR